MVGVELPLNRPGLEIWCRSRYNKVISSNCDRRYRLKATTQSSKMTWNYYSLSASLELINHTFGEIRLVVLFWQNLQQADCQIKPLLFEYYFIQLHTLSR